MLLVCLPVGALIVKVANPLFSEVPKSTSTDMPRCSALSDSQRQGSQVKGRLKLVVPTRATAIDPQSETEDDRMRRDKPIAIVGGGVSGIFAALTLVELGYHNVTILEREMRVGGKAAAFEYSKLKYPVGAVGTPLALPEASFGESKLLERPLRFGASLFGRTGRQLQILSANNLVIGTMWPQPFPASELTNPAPVSDWKGYFGARGSTSRFYPHRIDFAPTSAASDLANTHSPLSHLVIPRWGAPQTAWPLVYVSAHGYGVAQAADAPPLYYWMRFAQKSTNAGAGGPLGMSGPLGKGPIGPRGPALRGWDSTSLFERKLRAAGVRVRTGSSVTSIVRSSRDVRITTTDGTVGEYDRIVLASDLKGALTYLDADAAERDLFGKIVHQPYYTVTSFISLPWLASGSVYYLGDHQAPGSARDNTDAGHATAGCPTIMLKANKQSNLTITWAYGGAGIGAPQMEACLRDTVLKMGGKFGGVHFIKPWHDYFPHVSAADLQDNFHQRLDVLQGRKRMVMVGEIFNLPLVSECVDWARYLVRREFATGGHATGDDKGVGRSPDANSRSRQRVPKIRLPRAPSRERVSRAS